MGALTRAVLAVLLLGAAATGLAAQNTTAGAGAIGAAADRAGMLERILVHGPNLAGNLSGDSAARPVTVYLPPGYATDPLRRYPVIYFLHGYTDDDLHWMGWQRHFVNVPAAVDAALDADAAQEMIVVMPNAYTRFQGSMYSNSVTTGNWEYFVILGQFPF